MNKKCSRCKQNKPLDDFYPDRSKRGGRTSRCKDCGNLASNVHRFNKNSGLSLSIEQYIGFSSYTDDNCSICGVQYSNKRKSTRKVLDHDHETGNIRGFICSQCNLILGMVNDDTEILKRLGKHLTQG